MVSLPKFLIFSSSKLAVMSGVQTGPGATPFTLIPLSLVTCFASALVKLSKAAFVGAYARSCGFGLKLWIETVLIIEDPSGSNGTAALQIQNGAKTLVLNV